MRKKAYWKDLFLHIKSHLSQFISSLLILAMGIGFYIGIQLTGVDMRATIERYYQDQHIADARVTTSFGASKTFIDFLTSIDPSARYEAVYTSERDLSLSSGPVTMMVYSLTPSLQEARLLEGRWIEKDNELLLDSRFAQAHDIKIGDWLTFDNNEDLDKSRYQVVGLVQSPYYLTYDKGQSQKTGSRIEGFVFVDRKAFVRDVASFVLVSLGPVGFGSDYDQVAMAYENKVLAHQKKLEGIQSKDLLEKGRKALLEGQEKYDREISQAQRDLDQAQKDLSANQAKIDSGILQLVRQMDPSRPLDQNRLSTLAWIKGQLPSYLTRQKARLDQAKIDLDKGEKDYQKGLSDYQKGIEEFNQKKADLEGNLAQGLAQGQGRLENVKQGLLEARDQALASGQDDLVRDLDRQIDQVDKELARVDQWISSAFDKDSQDPLRSQLSYYEKQLNQAKKDLDQGRRRLDQGWKDYHEGRNKLLTARKDILAALSKLQAGQEKLNQGQVDYQNGLARFNKEKIDGKEALDKAEKHLDDLAHPQLFVDKRATFISNYQAFYDDSQRIERIGQIFPLFLFLIASLVSLSTMNRMVEDQKTQMGIMAALGYSQSQIQFKYIFYGFMIFLVSLGLGMVLGYLVVPSLIYNAYQLMYDTPDLVLTLALPYLILPLVLALVSTVGVAFFVSRSLLSQMPSQLLRPDPPKSGKRILLERLDFFWKRLSFLYKITLRNLIRNKARFLMTLVGVAGCSGLLLTAFGLVDSIVDLPRRQFEKVWSYDGQVMLKRESLASEKKDLEKLLVGKGDVKPAAYSQVVAKHKEYSVDSSLMVVTVDPLLDSFVHLHDEKTSLSLDKGVVVSRKLSQLLRLSVGDTIDLSSVTENLNVSLTVTGICDQYIGHTLYVDRSLISERDLANNAFLFKHQGSDFDMEAFSKEVSGQPGVLTVVDIVEISRQVTKSMNSFYFVILFIIVSAALLALIVLYNLSSMNLMERIREVATLKVLGFNSYETSQYLIRENMILVVVSSLVGLVFGIFLHHFVIVTAEIDTLYFIREIKWTSYVWTLVLTLVFSLVDDLILAYKIRKIDMLGALKSVE